MPWKAIAEMVRDLGGAQGAILALAGAGAFVFMGHKKGWITISRSEGHNVDHTVCHVPECHDTVIRTGADVAQMKIFHATLSEKLDVVEAAVPAIGTLQKDVNKLFDLAGENSKGIQYISGRIDEALRNGKNRNPRNP